MRKLFIHIRQNLKICRKRYMYCYLSSIMRKLALRKKKTQIITAKLIRAFVFATWIVQSLYFLNLKFQASSIFCGCTARFVSDLVGNPEARFSCNVAQLSIFSQQSFSHHWLGIFLSPLKTNNDFFFCNILKQHYESMSVQYAAISKGGKNDNFLMKKFDIFSYFCSKHRL